ncbi:hypothetical protein EPR50_G00176570 [Perca flavescens]|uniref:Uncharacterized protein n=1 Tax=Perca flavescens TaxID=8167 RepID=A0A484CGP6_PERFV|nr:hypothetical protein EPR50_G00176570 [Perca flavescens]
MSNKQKDACTHCYASTSSASSHDGPGLLIYSCLGEESWVVEVGWAKRGNSGPVPSSTFNERSDHAGVKVQVEQTILPSQVGRLDKDIWLTR